MNRTHKYNCTAAAKLSFFPLTDLQRDPWKSDGRGSLYTVPLTRTVRLPPYTMVFEPFLLHACSIDF